MVYDVTWSTKSHGLRYPNLAVMTEEMEKFVEHAVEKKKAGSRGDRHKKKEDYEAVVFVYQGKEKELYVLNPGGDQRMALKGFTRPEEEPAEISELGREGVFMRQLGSLQSSIDWYYSLFKLTSREIIGEGGSVELAA